MNSTILTTTQFNILNSSDSGSDVLDKLIFKNESVSVKQTVLWSRLIVVTAVLLMVLAAYGIYVFYHTFNDILLNPLYNPVLYGLFIVINGWLLFRGGTFIYKLSVFLKLKTIESVRDAVLPTTTVIVSTYNEGKKIYNTLINLAKSDYPEEKLQLIAVDEGSNDDTWSWMREAENDLGNKVTILKQSETMAANEALNNAFNWGAGDVFVTINKGTEITADTLRWVVSTFVVKRKQTINVGNIVVTKNKRVVKA